MESGVLAAPILSSNTERAADSFWSVRINGSCRKTDSDRKFSGYRLMRRQKFFWPAKQCNLDGLTGAVRPSLYPRTRDHIRGEIRQLRPSHLVFAWICGGTGMQETADHRLVISTFDPISQHRAIEPDCVADSDAGNLLFSCPTLNRVLRYPHQFCKV